MFNSFDTKTSLEAFKDIGTNIQKQNRPPHAFEEPLLLLLVEYYTKNVKMIADYAQLRHQVPQGFVVMQNILKCKI